MMKRLIAGIMVSAAVAGSLPATTAGQSAAPTVCSVAQAESHARSMFAGTSPVPKSAWAKQIALVRCQATRANKLAVRAYDQRLHKEHAARVAAAKKAAITTWHYATASYYIDPSNSGNCCGFNSPQGVAVCGSGGGPCVPMGTKIDFTYGGHRATCVADDHGPYVPGRAWDLDQGCAAALGFSGVQTVGYHIE